MYVTPTVRENCAHFHVIFDLSTFLCFKRISEGHFLCRVIRSEMKIISRAESLLLCYSIFLEVVGLHGFRC